MGVGDRVEQGLELKFPKALIRIWGKGGGGGGTVMVWNRAEWDRGWKMKVQ